MQIVVNGLLMQYERSGKGKPVVLLHGWADSSQGFTQLQAELSRQYDVTALDLPGFGGSQIPNEPWDVTDYAKYIGDTLTKLGLQPYAVVGHSNGGAILIRGLSHSLFSADKLVLLSSAGIRGENRGRKKAILVVTKTGKILTSPLPKSVKRKLRQKTYQAVGSDMLVAEQLQETFKRVVADDVRGDARAITIPTLLIYGEQDTATPVRYGRILHEAIKDSDLKILPNAGHFIHHDQPKEVTKLIEDFLQ